MKNMEILISRDDHMGMGEYVPLYRPCSCKQQSHRRFCIRWLGCLESYRRPREIRLHKKDRTAQRQRSACTTESESFDSPGQRHDVRVENDGLVVEGQPVHMELFPEDVPEKS